LLLHVSVYKTQYCQAVKTKLKTEFTRLDTGSWRTSSPADWSEKQDPSEASPPEGSPPSAQENWTAGAAGRWSQLVSCSGQVLCSAIYTRDFVSTLNPTWKKHWVQAQVCVSRLCCDGADYTKMDGEISSSVSWEILGDNWINTKPFYTPENVLISSHENAFKDMIFYQEIILFWLPLGMFIAFA